MSEEAVAAAAAASAVLSVGASLLETSSGRANVAENGLITPTLVAIAASERPSKNVCVKNFTATGAMNITTMMRYVEIRLVAVFWKMLEQKSAVVAVVRH